MTSSLRNSIHRRNHKERSQPTHRTRLGFLEKHKDYVKRARDYHSKQDRLRRLRQKAAERNKDEFYFGMVKEKTQDGVHTKDRGNVALPVDVVKVLKTQDENYVRTMRSAGLKKIDKLKSQLTALADLFNPGSLDDGSDVENDLGEDELQILRDAGIIAGPSARKARNRRTAPKHIVFVDNEEQVQQYTSTKFLKEDKEGSPSEDDVDLGWKAPSKTKTHKRRKSKHASEIVDQVDEKIGEQERREEASQHRRRLLKELSARLVRDRQLRYTIREFEMQRLLMGRGDRMKLRGIEKVEGEENQNEEEANHKRGRRRADEATYKPRVYKWRLERKR